MHSKYFSLVSLIVIAALNTACSSPPPVIQGMELDPTPSEAVPLAALVAFQTDRPTTVDLEFDDGQRTWRVDARVASSTNHFVPILGMRPGRNHTVRVVITDEEGATAISEPLEITTEPLPDDFPPIEVSVSEPDRMEPGVTLLEPVYRSEDESEIDYSFLVAVDEAGEVVWYYKATHDVADARRLQNGNLLYRSGRAGRLYEIDMLGNVVSEWHSNRAPEDDVGEQSIHVDTETFHHEAFETGSGNILTVSTEVRPFDQYPTSDMDPEAPRSTSDVVGDVLVEFSRNGQVLREAKLLDLLDPYRIGYGSLGGGYWAEVYGETSRNPRRDWAHTNAVVMDDSERYVIASPRYQDAVVKIDLETSELVWILGNHDDWGPEWQDFLLEPRGDLLWPYHQHAPMITPHGTILMFDNGNLRARPFEEPMAPSESFSRAVEYSVDEENMEVRQVWSYGGPGDEKFFSRFISDADWMPETGNVLVNFGGLVSDAEGNPVGEGSGHNWVRIVEVTHDMPAEKVFELFIDDDRPKGWTVFRAERLPRLYP